MKRLFRIGSGLFIYSIIPVLSWLLLAVIIGDSRIVNVFSIIFPLQFVWSILKCFFGSGANIRKLKENDINAIWNSIFWGVFFSTIIFAIPIIFVDNYISFFGQNVEFYKTFVVYGIALLFLQSLLSYIIEMLYFEDNEKQATFHLFAFNIINFCVLIGLSIFIKNLWVSFIITLGILLVYIFVLYVKKFKKFKIKFNFYKNFKYESANIVSFIFMLVIYLFGFKNAFSMGPEYLKALTLVALCTDPQWDTLSAITIVAKIDISQNRYNYKKEIMNSYFFTVLVMFSSIILVFALSNVYDVVLKIALCYLAFQVFDSLLLPFNTIMETYTQLVYSPILNTIVSLSLKFVRIIPAVLIVSPYCTEIGQISHSILAVIIYMIISLIKYKIIDNKLQLKKK